MNETTKANIKRAIMAMLPVAIILIFMPIYRWLDHAFLKDLFGCGCVPEAYPNVLNIPINANQLRGFVFLLLPIGLTIWSVFISRSFTRKIARVLYCIAVFLVILVLGFCFANSYMFG